MIVFGRASLFVYWVHVELAYGWFTQPLHQALPLPWAIGAFLESIAIGGLAGLVGGLAFGVWMERAGFFPLVAGLVGSDSPGVGRALHFLISVAIGAIADIKL